VACAEVARSCHRDAARLAMGREALLAWYGVHRRVLPWREQPTPYHVWVSELMLQQTQVATVCDYYARWLARFPTLADVAQAEEAEVLALWSGLGYYRRARALWSGARQVVARFGGELPSEPGLLQTLPGVGPYTAGAIASIAFGRDVAAVDGNVARVLSRWCALGCAVDRGCGLRTLWQVASALVAPGPAGELNQGLMDLGSGVCTPRGPRCGACPLLPSCMAAASGDAESFPLGKAKVKRRLVVVAALVVVDGAGRVLLGERRSGALLGALWEPPMVELSRSEVVGRGAETPRQMQVEAEQARASMEAWIQSSVVGLARRCRLAAGLGPVRHEFTHLRMRVWPWVLRVDGRVVGGSRVAAPGYGGWQWLGRTEWSCLGLSRLAEKVLEAGMAVVEASPCTETGA